MRVDKAGIDVDLFALDQAGLHAWLDGAQKNVLEHLAPPTPAGLGEHAVSGRGFVEVVTQEPEIIQAFGQALHEFALAGHVIEKEQEHELDQDDGIDAFVAVAAIAAGDLRAHEGEVDDLSDAAQRMITADPVLQINPIAEERLLRLVNAHHTPDPIIPDPDLFKVFPRKVDLGNRPRGCAPYSGRNVFGIDSPKSRRLKVSRAQIAHSETRM
jgi:hypothetical protein